MLRNVLVAAGLAVVAAQVNKENSLTPDAYWHNRYHAILSMAAYGDYNNDCPIQTFTEEAKMRNFPNSTYPPWDVLGTFGPTASGAQGFTAIVPEMNKALIVFQGNYALEQNISTEVVDFSALDENLLGVCNYFGKENGFGTQNCTMNAFALQGYLEAKEETNNWEQIITAYSGAGLVFSITGHGLGGMHALAASIDLNHQNICYYSHSYGAPRMFNGPGAFYYNYNFWGESGERGITQNDEFTESIPESTDYVHAGTPFWYSGYNNTALGPNWTICFDGNDDPQCKPQQVGQSTPLQDHYWYFTPVGQCGAQYRQELDTINDWLSLQGVDTSDFPTGNNTGSSPNAGGIIGAGGVPDVPQPTTTAIFTLPTANADTQTNDFTTYVYTTQQNIVPAPETTPTTTSTTRRRTREPATTTSTTTRRGRPSTTSEDVIGPVEPSLNAPPAKFRV